MTGQRTWVCTLDGDAVAARRVGALGLVRGMRQLPKVARGALVLQHHFLVEIVFSTAH